MMRFLILAFLISSCGMDERIMPEKPHKKQLIFQVEELKPYIDMFERDSAIYGDALVVDDLIIGFGEADVEGDDHFTLGVCYRATNRTPEIVLDINHWEKMSDTRRMLLVYHELGHCVLNRSHIEEEDYDSIMNPILISTSQYEEDPDYFLGELFDLNYKGDWLMLHDSEHKNCDH